MAKSVKYARHAVAIDDERRTFHPRLWDEKGHEASDLPPKVRKFVVDDIRDIYLVAEKLKAQEAFFSKKRRYEEHPVSKRIDLMKSKDLLVKFNPNGARDASDSEIKKLKKAVVEDFNRAVKKCSIFKPRYNEDRKDLKSVIRSLSMNHLNGEPDPSTEAPKSDIVKAIDYEKEQFDSINLSMSTKALMDRFDPGTDDPAFVNQLLIEETYNLIPQNKPKIKQVWFAGMHTDVGGGYEDRELSHIPLLWMVQEAMDLGLRVYKNHKVDLNPNATGKMHDSRAGIGRLYRQCERSWNRATNHNRSPLVHESVCVRNQSESMIYEPWILKDGHDIEPWSQRAIKSVQFDDHHVWRECFWGWNGAFTAAWKDIRRIQHNEQHNTITLLMKKASGREDVVITGSLPGLLTPLVSQLEMRLDQSRQKEAATISKKQDKKHAELIRKLEQQDEKQEEILAELAKKVDDFVINEFVLEDKAEDEELRGRIRELSEQFSTMGKRKSKKKKNGKHWSNKAA